MVSESSKALVKAAMLGVGIAATGGLVDIEDNDGYLDMTIESPQISQQQLVTAIEQATNPIGNVARVYAAVRISVELKELP